MCRLQTDNYKRIRNKLVAEAKALTISLFLYLWLSYKNCLFSMKRAKKRKINDE